MNTKSSDLFNKEGYISLREYVEDINYMRERGPWKLPLRISDKAQLFFLGCIVKYSWFESAIYMKHDSWYSPAYSIIINHLKKYRILDNVHQEDSFFKDFSYVSAARNISINNTTFIMSGYSAERDIEVALSKSLGEIIERMISGIYDNNKTDFVNSPKVVQKKYKVVYPPKYHRFLKVQQDAYRELQHNPNVPFGWVKGMNLITKENTYIPRHITSWFGYAEARTLKEKLVDQTSNGCAGYFTREGATLRALLEGVSRDGFFVYWLTRTAPQIIQQDTLPIHIKEIVSEFASRGITLYLLDVMSLAIPSVYVVAINHDGDVPKVVVSGSAGVTYEDAIIAALNEMVMIGTAFYEEKKNMNIKTNPKPFLSDINSSTRRLYWQGKEKVEQLRWFISGKEVSYAEISMFDFGDKAEDGSKFSDIQKLKVVLNTLENQGEDYYPVVYYPKNKLQEALGFYIAQVYIPKAFPLYLRECYGTFDSDRLEEFAASKNIKNWELNEEPHMFN